MQKIILINCFLTCSSDKVVITPSESSITLHQLSIEIKASYRAVITIVGADGETIKTFTVSLFWVYVFHQKLFTTHSQLYIGYQELLHIFHSWAFQTHSMHRWHLYVRNLSLNCNLLLQQNITEPEAWSKFTPNVQGLAGVQKIIITIYGELDTYIIRDFIACGNFSEGISLTV